MKIAVNWILECGEKLSEIKEYFFNTPNERENQIAVAKFESYVMYRRVGLDWYCPRHNDIERIKNVNTHVVEFDARREIV